jgi:hypothetical protein
MQYIEIDFYTGFLYARCLVLWTRSDDCSRKIFIWEGFYTTILERIERIDMTIDDDLNDLIRCYDEVMANIDSEENPSQVLNLERILPQLRNAIYPPDTSLEKIYYDAENRIIVEMITLFSEAIEKNLKIYVHRE